MKSLSLICCGFLCAVQAKAETNNVRSLSLEEAIQLAVQHNFDVQITRLTPQIDALALWGDYAYYDPAFTIGGRENFRSSGGGFNAAAGTVVPPNTTYDQSYNAGVRGTMPWGLNYNVNATTDKINGTSTLDNGTIFDRPNQYSTFAGIDLSQPLLKNFWTDNVRTTIAIAKNTLKADEYDFRARLISVVSQTEQAYYELIFSYENIKVQQAAVDLARRLVAENKRKVEVGALAALDEKQAEAQAATSEAALIQAYGQLDNQQNVLKSLITDQYGTWHDVTITTAQKLVAVPEKFDIQESWRKGVTKRPDLLRAKVNLESRGITLKYQYNQLFPQLDLVGSYGRNGLGGTLTPAIGDIRDERLPSYSFGGQLTIPLSNRGARSAYRQTKAGIAQAMVAVKQLEQGILIAIDNSIKSANTYYQSVQATRAAREYAELALEAEQKKLEVGKSTSFQVLQLQKDLTTARLNEIRALANYNEALSTIASSEGTTLEKFKLNVRVY